MGTFSGNRGITLIETAILLVVLGLLAVPALRVYMLYREAEITGQSKGSPVVIQSALQKYVLRTGRYPRPAPRDLAYTHASFGAEYTGAVAACTVGSPQVCRATGFRDVVAPAGNDPVLIGDVPYAELGLPLYYYADGYGSKFTYAVTESLTDSATFSDAGGVIRLTDRSGGNHRDTNSNLHYAIISHGGDQRGGFSEGGALIRACSGTGTDIENCDNDGHFNSNFEDIGVSPNSVYARYQSDATGSGYYDDYLVYSTSTATDIWTRTAGTPDIYSRNQGNVRIGAGTAVGATINPTARVHVMGNVRGAAVETNRLCPPGSCSAPGSTAGLTGPENYAPNVFTPSIIAGPVNPANEGLPGGGIACDEAGLTGISNSNEVCGGTSVSITPSTGVLLGTCASGWPRGTNAAGQFVCGVP